MMSQPQNHQLIGPTSTYMACTPSLAAIPSSTHQAKASSTVNQAMESIAQGAIRKAYLKQKQWFMF